MGTHIHVTHGLRARALGCLLVCAGVGLGCAADDSASDSRGRGLLGVAGQAGAAAGTGGTGQGQGQGKAGAGFGNADPNTAFPNAGMSGGAGTVAECAVGVFCTPSVPDPEGCGSLTLEGDVEVTRTPANLLVIFDQSGSMGDGWGVSGQSKLLAARTALVNALTPLQDVLTVGAIFFPTAACIPALPPPQGGAVAPIDAPTQIAFQPAATFLPAWEQHWTMPGAGSGIGTPMQEAFDRAAVAIESAALTGPTAVFAFTDGAPNCFPDPMLTGIPTMTEPNHAAEWLAMRQIKTYMVGLPGAAGAQILDQVAQSGGTMNYILPDDPAQLEMKLREVVQEQVKTAFDSCTITLSPPAMVPDELHLVVVEKGVRQEAARDLGNGSGWSVSDDGALVEMTGALCDNAKAGTFEQITFEFGCVELPPLPPPAPLE